MGTKIYQTLMYYEGENDILYIDTIEYDGKMWLVPRWLEAPSEGWKTPVRIILLDLLYHQVIPSGVPADFLLKLPMPKDVFEGRIPKGSEDEFVVIERPDVKIPIPRGIH